MSPQRSNFQMDSSYIDVATRLVEFRDKHPEGCLQPADPAQPYRIETIGDTTWIVVVAAAYRTPDDPRPGIGMAYERFPGATPYTRNSELQNAETSAWGRAIVAALAADTKKGIASAEEIRNRRAEDEARTLPPVERGQVSRSKGKPAGDDPWDVPPPVEVKRAQAIEYGKGHYDSPQAFAADFELHAGAGALVATATEEQLDAFLAAVGVAQEVPA